MNSPFSTEYKITMMEAFSTVPICGVLGAIASQVGLFFGWSVLGMLALSVTLCLLFMLTPLANKVRAFVRRKAESYYYGT
jgi:hypothetical protein